MKNRHFYSMLAFLTVCAFLLCLFFNGISVFAVSSGQLIDYYSISDDILYGSDTGLNDYPFLYDSSESSTLQTNYHNNYDLGFVFNGSIDIDTSFNYYHIIGNPNNYSFYFANYPDGSFMCFDDSYYATYCPKDSIDALLDNNINNTVLYYDGSNSGAVSTSWLTQNNTITIDGVDYYYYDSRYTSSKVMNTNMPIYNVNDCDSVSSVSGLTDYNNNTMQQGGETSQNNLYLEDGYFIWSTPASGYFGELPLSGYVEPTDANWFDGSVSFNYQLTSYQLQHPDEFILRFTAHVDYYIGSYLGGAHTDLKYYGFHDPAPGQVFDVNMTSLVGKNTYSFDIEDSFMSGFLSWYNNLSVDLSDKSINVSDATFTLRISAQVVDRSGNAGSDTIDTLNFLNNTVKNNSSAITNNNYPYTNDNSGSDLPAPTNQDYINQTGNGQLPTSGSTSGNISVVNNNYNNRLIDPKPVVDYTKNELLPNENDTNYVGLLEEQTHEDGFITLLSNTFSFVPVSVWNSLSHYFTILLTMIVAFFGLRLILDIL